jgi:hypothetical protein
MLSIADGKCLPRAPKDHRMGRIVAIHHRSLNSLIEGAIDLRWSRPTVASSAMRFGSPATWSTRGGTHPNLLRDMIACEFVPRKSKHSSVSGRIVAYRTFACLHEMKAAG